MLWVPVVFPNFIKLTGNLRLGTFHPIVNYARQNAYKLLEVLEIFMSHTTKRLLQGKPDVAYHLIHFHRAVVRRNTDSQATGTFVKRNAKLLCNIDLIT